MTTTVPKVPLALAPMEGVTEPPFRLFMHLASAPSEMTTPFLRVTDTYPAGELPEDYAPEHGLWRDVAPYDLRMQLMASRVDAFLRVAEQVLSVAHEVEINCGCPAPRAVGHGAGSSILRDPEQFGRTIERLVRELGPGRLSVKMRTGFDDDDRFPELIAGLAGLPLARLTVHGRTRAQRYKGKASWQRIDEAARTLAIPVVASGDVVSRASLRQLLAAAPRIAGVIIGRGALRHPWIFREFRDDAPVVLSSRALALAIASFALLHELMHLEPQAVLGPVGRELLARQAGTSEDAWQEIAASLASALGRSGSPFDIEISRFALGRTKMLWNYLRSSLPPPFFEPRLFRAKSLGELLAGITDLADRATGRDLLELAHDPARDELYS